MCCNQKLQVKGIIFSFLTLSLSYKQFSTLSLFTFWICKSISLLSWTVHPSYLFSYKYYRIATKRIMCSKKKVFKKKATQRIHNFVKKLRWFLITLKMIRVNNRMRVGRANIGRGSFLKKRKIRKQINKSKNYRYVWFKG